MIYIYDILLNFSNNRIYDFYEWKKDDNIEHIRKIKLIKVDSRIMDDFELYDITIKDEFSNEIKNGMELFKTKEVKPAILLTDGYRVLAVLFNDKFKSIKKSKLLLEEELDVIDISHKLKEMAINYKKTNKSKEDFLTRREFAVKEGLKKELIKSYKNKEVDKLKYIYMEYFEKSIDNLDDIYNDLINSLNDINEKHIKIFDMLNYNLNR